MSTKRNRAASGGGGRGDGAGGGSRGRGGTRKVVRFQKKGDSEGNDQSAFRPHWTLTIKRKTEHGSRLQRKQPADHQALQICRLDSPRKGSELATVRLPDLLSCLLPNGCVFARHFEVASAHHLQ